jgi:tetratricopeptide (TPR) repeat protein
MFQNWLNLITSFKFSLPNVLFFIFLALGIFCWCLYSEISKVEDSKQFLNSVKNIIKNLFRKSRNNLLSNFGRTPVNEPPAQKLFNVKPVELNIRETYQGAYKKDGGQIAPIKRIREQNTQTKENYNFSPKVQEVSGITGTLEAPDQVRDEIVINANTDTLYDPRFSSVSQPLTGNQLNSNLLPGLEEDLHTANLTSANQELVSRPQVNILREASEPLKSPVVPPAAVDTDFAGYVALQETPKLPDYSQTDSLANSDNSSDKGNIFFPLIETRGNSIPRFRQIMALKRSLEVNEVLFLIGGASLGKSYLVSLLAREVKYAEDRSVISFSFNQHTNSLAAGLKLLLIDQLKFPAKLIDNPIQAFFKLVSSGTYLILLNNVELLQAQDLMLLYNCNLGSSKLIMLSSSLSARSLCQNNSLIKKNIIELQELDQETVQNFFLERIPQGFNLSPLFNNKILRFVKGNPLVLMLFCAYLEKELRRSPEANLEEIFKYIDNLRVISDRSVPINLCKMLNLTLGTLTTTEKDVLLFCCYLPIESISSSLIENIFNLAPAQGIRMLDALNALGLIQRIPGEPLQNPRYGVHSSVKDYVYKEFRIDQPHLNELVGKIVFYYYSLLQDKTKLIKENSSFLISGLLYSLKVLSSNLSGGIGQLGNFYEKAVDYLHSMGLASQIESHILPIYEENLKTAGSQEMKAFWQRLLGMCLNLIANDKQDLDEKLETALTGIDHLSFALGIYSSTFSNGHCRQVHNDLGNAYVRLAAYNEPESNLIKAIEHFKKAIQVQVKGSNSLEETESQINLGNAYLSLYRVKPSIIGLQLVVQILGGVIRSSQAELPLETKSYIHQSLGNALRSLANHQEPIPNLQGAINEYKVALNGADSQNKALIYNSLGCCFWKLAKYHHPVQNLELAISVYRKSLEHIAENTGSAWSFKANNIEHAVTQNNLGTAYKTLASLKDPQQNVAHAINSFHEALYIAEKQADHNLVKVVNQHLHELSGLVDSLMNTQPEQHENLRKFKQAIHQDFYIDNNLNRLN